MADSNSLLIKINGSAKDFLDEVDKVKKQTESLEKTLKATAKASAIAFAAFAGTIALATREFSKYETALVGVGKTTNIQGKALDNFGKRFQKLSGEIPVATNELLGIAQAAGQLGVTGEEELIKFTETVAKLGVATDLTGEQAAVALTRILNVTKESIDNIDTFGSVIVRLGNNFAASESEIVKVTTEVSRATSVFGVSSTEAAGLATALKSLGQQAQLGGSVVGKTFLTIQKVINEGGKSFENLAQITGIAGGQLRQTFANDSTEVFQKFIEGLGNVEGGTSAVFKALESFGLKGDEVNKVLPVLAKNSELLGDALGTAADEAKKATALNEEAATAFDTLANKAQLTRNNLTTLGTNLGEKLAPAIESLLNSVNGLLQELNALDDETLDNVASFLKFGAAFTAALTTVSVFLLGIVKMKGLLAGLKIAFNVGRVAAVGFTSALTFGLTAVIAFLPEIISGVKSLIGLFNSNSEPKTLKDINSELDKLKKKQEEVNNLKSIGDATKDDRLRGIQEEIDKLEDLRQKKIAATQDFGTGEFLIRPTTDGSDPLAGLDKSLGQDNEIPLQTNAQEKKEAAIQAALEAAKKEEQIVDEATQKRIDAAKREAAALKEINEARLAGATEEELENLERKKRNCRRAI